MHCIRKYIIKTYIDFPKEICTWQNPMNRKDISMCRWDIFQRDFVIGTNCLLSALNNIDQSSSSLLLLGHWADLMSLESFDDTCYTFKPPKVYFDPLTASEPNEVYPWIGSLSLSSSRICIAPAPLLSTTILRYRVSRCESPSNFWLGPY